ncbi:hypothetical protein AMECASPLE_029796 [Ameca splendens]|uniref:DUF5641 domain-containing protein n=1 Tax=Ameca splendens TaxID=208324 RepID=A0ABV0Z3R1_9TELE
MRDRSGLMRLVFIEDSVPLHSWFLGKVIEVVPDKLGVVHQVRIRMKTTTIDRPITKVSLPRLVPVADYSASETFCCYGVLKGLVDYFYVWNRGIWPAGWSAEVKTKREAIQFSYCSCRFIWAVSAN